MLQGGMTVIDDGQRTIRHPGHISWFEVPVLETVPMHGNRLPEQ